jgi:hypothetical protein
VTTNTESEKKMTAIDERLEWWQGDKQPHCLTARRQVMSDGSQMWVASRCGLYLSTDALLTKHGEMLAAFPDARVIRFQLSDYDWVSRAERNGRRIL